MKQVCIFKTYYRPRDNFISDQFPFTDADPISPYSSVQGQVGWPFGQSDLVEDAPAHSRAVRLDDL